MEKEWELLYGSPLKPYRISDTDYDLFVGKLDENNKGLLTAWVRTTNAHVDLYNGTLTSLKALRTELTGLKLLAENAEKRLIEEKAKFEANKKRLEAEQVKQRQALRSTFLAKETEKVSTTKTQTEAQKALDKEDYLKYFILKLSEFSGGSASPDWAKLNPMQTKIFKDTEAEMNKANFLKNKVLAEKKDLEMQRSKTETETENAEKEIVRLKAQAKADMTTSETQTEVRNLTVPPPEPKNNTKLYVGIGIGAVVILIVLLKL